MNMIINMSKKNFAPLIANCGGKPTMIGLMMRILIFVMFVLMMKVLGSCSVGKLTVPANVVDS